LPVALPAPLDAEAVVEAVFLLALAAAYSFLIALFCYQRENGLEPASGLSFLNFSYRAYPAIVAFIIHIESLIHKDTQLFFFVFSILHSIS